MPNMVIKGGIAMQQLVQQSIEWCHTCGSLKMGDKIQPTRRNHVCNFHDWKDWNGITTPTTVKVRVPTVELKASRAGGITHGPPCVVCNSGLTVRRGSCYYCDDCGTSTGCS